MVSQEFPSVSGGLITDQVAAHAKKTTPRWRCWIGASGRWITASAPIARNPGMRWNRMLDAQYFDGELKPYYKNISFAYRHAKNVKYAGRVGAISKIQLNFHFGHDEAVQRREFEGLLRSSAMVVPLARAGVGGWRGRCLSRFEPVLEFHEHDVECNDRPWQPSTQPQRSVSLGHGRRYKQCHGVLDSVSDVEKSSVCATLAS